MERKRSVRRRRYERPFAKKCKDLLRQFIAFLFSNVGIIGLVISYTIAGAFIFPHFEKGYYMQVLYQANQTRNATLWRLWNYTLHNNPLNEELYKKMLVKELNNYQKSMIGYIQKGYEGASKEYSSKWSFAGAFLYSLTVITTIGYGNISPHTVEGKITTIVYAIVGMPLFLLYLSNIGDIMARSFKWIYANCCLCRWCPGVAKRRAERKLKRAQLRDEYSEDDEQDVPNQNYDAYFKQRTSIVSEISEVVTEAISEESYDVQAVTVPLTICLAIMVGYICGGALLFCKWEDWEFLDASYFCFISLSTIGFGDLVPGDKIYGNRHGGDLVDEVFELSFIFCSLYLMLGMALIAMCFNLMQEEVIHKIRTTVKTVKNILHCDR